MKILAVSDQPLDRLASLASRNQIENVEMLAGCGDLPYTYLEFLVTMMNSPLYYVPGNHDPAYSPSNPKTLAEGGLNIDLKMTRFKSFLIGGFGGSVRYRPDGTNQYTQTEAYLRAFQLLPRLILNRLQYGRALDLLIGHSPPFGIHDDDDPAHTGLKAINWLIRFARPRYYLHGHTHFYRNNIAPSESIVGLTRIINVYPYKIIDINH